MIKSFQVPIKLITKGRLWRIKGNILTGASQKAIDAQQENLRKIFLSHLGKNPLTKPFSISIELEMETPKNWPILRKRAALAGEITPYYEASVERFFNAILDALEGILWDDASFFDENVKKIDCKLSYALSGKIRIDIVEK